MFKLKHKVFMTKWFLMLIKMNEDKYFFLKLYNIYWMYNNKNKINEIERIFFFLGSILIERIYTISRTICNFECLFRKTDTH